MRTILIATIALLPLAACGQNDATPAENNTAATAFVPPPVQPPAPLPGQAHQVPLTAFVGKYPTDTVDGVTFFDRTEVANALIGAVGDDKLRRLMTGRDGVTVPIFRSRGAIGAHGCEQHDCAGRNWTFLVSPDGGTARACFHDAAAMGATSRWYDNDTPVARPGDCPQG